MFFALSTKTINAINPIDRMQGNAVSVYKAGAATALWPVGE
jgi:hypothetical protein